MFKGFIFENFEHDSEWRSHEEAHKRCEELRSKGLITDLVWLG